MAELNSSGSGVSNKTTVTTTGGSPQTYGGGMFGTGDLAGALLQTIRQGASVISNLGAGLTGQQNQSVTLDNEATQLGKQAATEKFVLATKKAETEYQQNTFLEGLQRIYNVDPAAEGNEIARNLAVRNSLEPQVAAIESQRLEAKAAYDAAASTDLLSNPVGYLMAQLKLPALAARHNALAQNKDAAQGTIDQSNANIQSRLTLLDASKKTNLANLSDQIRETALAEARVGQLISDSQLKVAEAATSAKQAGFTMQQIQLANMGFDNQRSGIMSMAQLKDMNEQTKWRNEQRAQLSEARQEKLDKAKADAEFDARLNAALAVVSKQKGLLEPMTVSRLKLVPKQAQEQWLYAALQGANGADLGSAMQFYFDGLNPPGVHAGGGSGILDTAKKLRETNDFYKMKVANEYRAKTGKTLGAKELDEAAFKEQQAEYEGSTGDRSSPIDLSSSQYDPGKKFNPYRAPVLAFTDRVMTSPEYAGLKNNAVVKAVVALNTEGKYQGADLPAEAQQLAIKSIKEQIKLGTISAAQAGAEIAQFYQAATTYNKQAGQHNLFGLGHQTQYMFSIEGDGDRTKTNLFSPVEVTRTLVKQATDEQYKRRLYQQLGPGALPVMLGESLGESIGIKGKLAGDK